MGIEETFRNRSNRRGLLEQMIEQGRLRSQRTQKIGRRDDGVPCPLSLAQQRLWLLDQIEPASPAYNMSAAIRLLGEVNHAALQQTFDHLVHRHESLRTTFANVDGQPTAQVAAATSISLPLLDLSSLPEGLRAVRTAELMSQEAGTPFNLSRGPLLRVTLLRLAPQEQMLFVTLHHIVADGWSIGVLMREFGTLYEAFAAGRPSPLPDLPIQYGDFALWQQQWLDDAIHQQQLAFWKERLAGVAVLNLPADRPRPAVRSGRGARVRQTLSAQLLQALRALSRQEGVTLFMTLLAAFQTLLWRYSGQADIAVGTPVAGRERPEIQGLIGFFVNSLVLRTDLSGNPSFRELLARVLQTTTSAYAHQELPFERVVEALQPERSRSLTPLFQVMFVLQSVALHPMELPGLKLLPCDVEPATAKFDLTLEMVEEGERLRATWEYSVDLFDEARINAMSSHFQRLLEAIVQNPDRGIAALPLLTDHDRQRLAVWNGVEEPAEPNGGIHEYVEAQVSRTPDAVAVSFGEQRCTYHVLNQRANMLAHHLRRRGAAPDRPIALFMERSLEMLIGLLAILKAGSPCLPLDPAYPTERLAYMLADAGAQMILTHEHMAPHLPAHSAAVVLLHDNWEQFAGESDANPQSGVEPDHLLYLIYTSGSTGRPKGIAMPHRVLANLLQWERSHSTAGPGSKTLQFTTLSFDAAFQEIFSTLTTGGELVLITEEQRRDLWALPQLLQYHRIERLYLPFVALQHLAEAAVWHNLYPTQLREVRTAGEQLKITPALVQLFGSLHHCTLHNDYGPSESHVVTSYLLTGAPEQWPALPPIGMPIAGARIYLLDDHLQPVPPGVAGELYIGSADRAVLARGYIGLPGLTAERFIPDSFSTRPGALMYRTGDIARHGKDGLIEFLRRSDDQIKVRGYRIEPAEIETLLAQHTAVREAVVVAVDDEVGQKRLVGYIVPAASQDAEAGAIVSAVDLRAYLSEQVPEYMVPTAFIALERLPLTPSGKVDRRSLPFAPALDGGGERRTVLPHTPVEQVLSAIWSALLGVERLSLHESFFALGGHSLLVVQVVACIHHIFGVDVPAHVLFTSPTISALAGFLLQEQSRRERVEWTAQRILQIMRPARAATSEQGETAQSEELASVMSLRDLFGTKERRDLLAKVLQQERLKAEGTQRIERGEADDASPLSFAQWRLWMLDQMEPHDPAYCMPAAIQLKGPLKITALQESLTHLVQRHESLRTTFAQEGGNVVAYISPAGPVDLPMIDLTPLPVPDQEARTHIYIAEAARVPFDLARGPLLRASLLRRSSQEHILLLTMHHIVADGWSVGVLTREFAQLYEALAAGRPWQLPELAIRYSDFARWQHSPMQREVQERQLAYWKRQLIDLPMLQLPTDRPYPVVPNSQGAQWRQVLPPALTEALHALSRQEGATLFMTLLAAFQVLLARDSGQAEFAVGSPVAGRNHPETEGLVGFFVNMLVLRSRLNHRWSFREVLAHVRTVATDGYAHQEVPFEQLVAALNPQRSQGQHPFFQVVFALQHISLQRIDLPGLSLIPLEIHNGTAKFDLTLEMVEGRDGLSAIWEYRTDLFDEASIVRMAGRFQTLLAAICDDPQARMADLPLLTQAEQAQYVLQSQGPAVPLQGAQCAHQLFEEQAKRSPDAVAVVCGERALTYAALNRAAEALAGYLRRRGVGPEALVGLCVERSPELIIGALGILKAGGAYLPLDPSYPPERLGYMLQDAGVTIALTQAQGIDSLPSQDLTWVCLDRDWEETAHGGGIHSEGDLCPRGGAGFANLAYVIYTSGSTGRPKGVQIEHGPLRSLIDWHRRTYQIAPGDRISQLSGVSFDASVWEIWPALASGASLYISDEETRLSPEALRDWLIAQNITIGYAPTPLAEALLALDWPAQVSMRTLLTGGDRLHIYPTARLPFALVNHYGPTENTVVATAMVVPADQPTPAPPAIGRPIDRVTTYILDQYLQPVPVGVSGELYIGGENLARGYLRRPALTAERFVPDPFGSAGGRLYRTGDMCRYRSDGNIDFLSRDDHQVKIRGFRIELGEIETLLMQHPAVREAVVIAHDDPTGNRRLVAYLVYADPAAPSLRPYLAAHLPDYMIPTMFVTLSALPLTPNGKVDRRALPAPDVQPNGETATPRTPTQEVVARIWEEVLGVARIGIHERFAELGGHSLLATRVMLHLRNRLGVELPVRDLFEAPTVAALSERVEAAMRAAHGRALPPILPVARSGEISLSFAQQRLWFLDQLEPGSAVYNLPIAVQIAGPLSREVLERCIGEVIRRHEALRTTFVVSGNQPVQVIHPPEPLTLTLLDLSEVQAQGSEAQRWMKAESAEPFDLERGPLVRAALIRLREQQHILFVNMHHIVGDGWSMGVFLREMAALYEAFRAGRPSPLPDLAVQYPDFAQWQRQYDQHEEMSAHIAYWKERLQGAPPLLTLPTDRPRPPVHTYRGAVQSMTIPASLVSALKALSERENVTLFMTLLATFQVLLHRHTGQDDLVIGVPVANRLAVETEGMIGFFVNMLALRIDLSGNPTFSALLARVREATLSAYAHQALPFEQLVDALQVERNPSHTPLFQVMFSLQNAPMPAMRLADLTLNPAPIETGSAKVDLTYELVEFEGELRLQATYRTDLFDATTIARMLRHFQMLLAGVTAQPDERVGLLPLMTAAEAHQMLTEWSRAAMAEPAERCIHEVYTAWAHQTPDAVAIICGDQQLTYGELNRRANRLAHRLQRMGVGPDVLVALCAERSLEMIVGLLAILKAGGAYVPLDPNYPVERLAFMLQDSGATVLLAHERFVPTLPAHGATVISLEAPDLSDECEESPTSHTAPDHLAYVMYTSGSTGIPKGVAITHRGVIRLVKNRSPIRPTPDDLFLHMSTISFDASTIEIWGPLLNGACVALMPPGPPALDQIKAMIERYGVTMLFLTTGLFHVVMEESPDMLRRVRCIMVGGEALSVQHALRCIHNVGEGILVNCYGPTENTTYTTISILTADELQRGVMPIGRPLNGTEVYVLDAHMQPVPIGIPGELYTGGDGLARCYLSRPELTAERFVPNPFGAGRLYRTGDLVRYMPDGQLEFLERIDQQVKIRGFRIELGEIEMALKAHPAVDQALVMVREDQPGDKRLVAYVATDAPPEMASTALRDFLQKRLPDYMMPAAIITLTEWPLSPSGKVDRRALPAPTWRPTTAAHVPPRSELEQTIAAVWREVLGVQEISIEDNFFDLGANSLLLVRAHRRLKEQAGLQLAVVDLFQYPTVSALARYLSAAQAPTVDPTSHARGAVRKELTNRLRQMRQGERRPR